MSSLSAGGDKSKATQPFLFLQELAQICLVLVPLSTGHFPACQFGPRHNPFPIILNFAGAKSEFRNLEINVITVILEKGCGNQANKCCGLLTGRNSQFSSVPEQQQKSKNLDF